MPFPIRVADAMTGPVHTVSPDTPSFEAAQTCDREQIGSVVVVEDRTPVGIVTSSDFVELLGTVSDPGARQVREFMSSPVTTAAPDTTIREAVETMQESGISRLVVLEDGAVVGIVTTDDIARIVPGIIHRSDLPTAAGTHHYRVRPETEYEQTEWEYESVAADDTHVSVGDRVEFTKPITERDVRTFAAVSGDTNRLHLDEEYAAETRFERRICHGTLVSSLISAALARLPGVTIYVSQDLSFLAPVEIGRRVTAVCEVVEDLGRDKYQLTTDVYDADTRVIEGQAVVLIDRAPETAAVETEALS